MFNAYNLRIALRTLVRYPLFSILSVLMLALGIAGTSAIFSVVNAMLLKPLPFDDSDRLVYLNETAPRWNLEFVGITFPDFAVWREENETFSAMGVFDSLGLNLSTEQEAVRVSALAVTYDLLPTLGLDPIEGRNFSPEEDRPGGARVTLLGHRLWRERFAANPRVVGSTVRLNNEPVLVIGVLPAEAYLIGEADLWVPLAADPTQRGSYSYSGIGRLKPAVAIEQAAAGLDRVQRALIDDGQATDAVTPLVLPLLERFLRDARPIAVVALLAVLLVFLIACTNVVSLVLARTVGRRREVGIRRALGAGRGAIFNQLLAESLILAVTGAIFGIALGGWLLQVLMANLPDLMPAWLIVSVDWRVLLFAAALSAVAAVLSGLLPAFQAAGGDAAAVLHESSLKASAGRSRSRVLKGLVALEVAVAAILVVTALLVAQSFTNVNTVDPGFNAKNLLRFTVSLPRVSYAEGSSRLAFDRNLIERAGTIPGVAGAAGSNHPPLSGHTGNFFEAEGVPPRGPDEVDPVVLTRLASIGYLDLMEIPFIEGQSFEPSDGTETGRRAIIVNETFARSFWNEPGVVGKRVRRRGAGDDDWFTVIGVTRDVKHYGLETEMRPGVYLPLAASPSRTLTFLVRTQTEPAAVVPQVRALISDIDPTLPIFRVETMEEALRSSMWGPRVSAWTFGVFAGIALLLAVGGLYGVVAYTVNQQQRELSIRMALGARGRQVAGGVLRRGMATVAGGLLVGLIAAVFTARGLEDLLFGVAANDLSLYLQVVLLLLAVTFLANLLPAWRATRIPPADALKVE